MPLPITLCNARYLQVARVYICCHHLIWDHGESLHAAVLQSRDANPSTSAPYLHPTNRQSPTRQEDGASATRQRCKPGTDLCQKIRICRVTCASKTYARTHRPDTNSVPGYGLRRRQIIIRNKEVSHRRNNIRHLQTQPTLHVCTETAPLPRVTSDPPRRPVRSREVDAGPK